MPTVDEVVGAYVKIRDKRSELKKAYELDDEVLRTQLDKLESFLLRNLDAVSANSMSTDHGTAYISEDVRASCGDWDAFWTFIGENGRFDMLEKRVSAKAVREFKDEHNDLPPGVTINTERVVRVRRN